MNSSVHTQDVTVVGPIRFILLSSDWVWFSTILKMHPCKASILHKLRSSGEAHTSFRWSDARSDADAWGGGVTRMG